MPPLRYHAGQLAIQEEAKTTHVAERLAHWVGPVADFAGEADLFLLAMADENGAPAFSALSGPAPLLETIGEPALRHRADAPTPASDLLRLRFDPGLAPRVAMPTPCGGLAINFAKARRARINGWVRPANGGIELVAHETFTLCRKYIAPSLPDTSTRIYGPASREPIALDDGWLLKVLAQSETMFLASLSPEGGPDVAHRGGPPGFLHYDPAAATLTWEEYVGDGVFKSAGNIRATETMTALVTDLASGDAAELVGKATYLNIRSGRGQRLSPLEQHHEDYPVQGVMKCEILQVRRLRRLMAPRRPVAPEHRITSRAAVEIQAPQ